MLLTSFLKLIRWKNLAIVFSTQFLIKYALIPSFEIQSTLTNLEFSLLVISTLLITAGGYIINDFFDLKTDSINKPGAVIIGKAISKKTALKLYYLLSVIGLLAGFILSYSIDKIYYSLLFLIVIAGLYFYSKSLKSKLIIGNVVVSFFIALSVFIVVIFEISPSQLKDIHVKELIKIVSFYTIFAFIINLIREITKDIEDINGDFNQNMKTLPIVIGRNRTQNILIVLSAGTMIAFSFFLKVLFFSNKLIVIYSVFFIISPLLYFIYKLYQAESKKDFSTLSKLLKLILIFGLLSFLILSI